MSDEKNTCCIVRGSDCIRADEAVGPMPIVGEIVRYCDRHSRWSSEANRMIDGHDEPYWYPETYIVKETWPCDSHTDCTRYLLVERDRPNAESGWCWPDLHWSAFEIVVEDGALW